jgi:ribosome-binding protein aMBF1 (putative translation factor)
MSELNEHFRRAFSDELEKSEMSRRDLAQATGYHVSYIHDILGGRKASPYGKPREPSLATWERLAIALDMEITARPRSEVTR